MTTEDFIAAVKAGEPSARELWDDMLDSLSVSIANVITLLCPQRFVLGGGVSLVGDLLFNPLRERVVRQGFAPYRGAYEIVPAELGDEVVLHGAIKLAFDADADADRKS